MLWPENPDVGERFETSRGITYEYNADGGWMALFSVSEDLDLSGYGIVFEDLSQTLTNKTYEDPTFTNISSNADELFQYFLDNYDLTEGVPDVPRNIQLAAHTKLGEDGKIDILIHVTWDFPLGADTDEKLSYETAIEDGDTGDITYHSSKGRSIWLNARSGVQYTISVRAISSYGVPGIFSDGLDITPDRKLLLPTRPTGLTAHGKFQRVRVSWDTSPDKDYKETNVYSSNANDFDTAELTGTVSGNKLIDDNLFDNTNYYYWITHVDRTNNESQKWPVGQFAGVLGTTDVGGVVDNTPPGIPLDLHLEQRTILDEDGKVDLKIYAYWSAPVGAATGVSYQINVYDSDDTFHKHSKGLSIKFPVTSGVQYDVKVRAVSGGGIPGDWTAIESLIPHKKDIIPSTPTGLTAEGKTKRVKLTWDRCTDKDYKETNIFRSTTTDFGDAEDAGSVSGNKFIDDGLFSDTNYYYWISHVDRTHNESNLYPSGSSDGILGTTSPDLETGEDFDPPNAPNNLQLDQHTRLDDDGKVEIVIYATWDAPVGDATGVHYELQLLNDGETSSFMSKDRSVRFHARSGILYRVRVRAMQHNGVEGDWTAYEDITPAKKADVTDPTGLSGSAAHKRVQLKWPASADKDYRLTRIYRALSNDFTLSSLSGTDGHSPYIDDDLANNTDYWYWITHVNTSGDESGKYPVSNTGGYHLKTNRINKDDLDDTVPNVPTGLTLTPRTNLDDDGKVVLQLIITWTAQTGAQPNDTYQLHINDGTDSHNFVVKDLTARIDVRSGVALAIRVRAITFAGIAGDFTAASNITPSKKATLPTIPAGLSVDGVVRRVKLSWTESADKDYAKTVIYRAVVNDFAFAAEIGRVHGTKFVDDALVNNTRYWYWITHMDRTKNESAKFPVSNTAGVTALTVRVKDDDTDDTPPNTPTALALAQRTNLDDDGQIELLVIATWTEHSAASAKDMFEIVVDDGTDTTRHHTKDARFKFRARSPVTYNVKVRAISFNGVAGNWSTEVPILTSKKSTLPTIPAGLATAANHKRIKLSWTNSADKDYAKTIIYRAATNDFTTAAEIGRVHGTRFLDDNLTSNTQYWYWITHLDRSFNESPKFPVSNTGGISATTTKIFDTDTDDTAPGTPTGVTLTPRTNVDEDGKVDLKVKVTWTAPVGASAKTAYEVYVDDGTDDWRIRSDDLSVRFEVRSAVLYTVKVRAISFNGVKGSWSTTATLTPSKKSTAPTTATGLVVKGGSKRNKLRWTKSPDKDWARSNIYRDIVNSFPASPYDTIKGSAFIDDDLTVQTYFYWITHVDTSGNEGAPSSVASDTPSAIGDGSDVPVPAIPTGLTLTQLSRDVNGDGKVDIAVKVTWNNVVDSTGYGVKITQGSDVSNHRAEDLSFIFPAKNVLYSVQVCSINTANGHSNYSTAVTITPAKKSSAPETPTSLALVPNHKRIRLTWDQCLVDDYGRTRIWRYASLANANADTSSTFLGGVKGEAFTDNDSLSNNTQYWYRIAHLDTSGNMSAKCTTVSATTLRVSDDDTDQTAAAVPTGLAVIQTNQDVDLDGKVDIAFTVSWNTAAGAKAYRVEITQGANVSNHTVHGLSYIHQAKGNKLYSVKVCSVSFNGTQSGFSSAVTITPAKKAAYADVATGLTVTAKPKGMHLKWTKPADKDYSYTEVTRVGLGVIAKISGSAYTDNDELTVNTAYQYSILNYDTSGNFGTASANSTGVTYKAAASADIALGAILEDRVDGSAPGAPGTPSLSSLSADIDLDGTQDCGILASWSAPGGSPAAKGYQVTIYSTTTNNPGTGGSLSGYTLRNVINVTDPSIAFKAKSNRYYKLTVKAISFSGTIGTASSANTAGFQPNPYSAVTGASGLGVTVKGQGAYLTWIASPDSDYKETIIFVNSSEVARVKGSAFTDTATRAGTYTYTVAHVNRAGTIGASSLGVNVTYRNILDTDTDATAPGAPSVPSLATISADIDGDGTLDTGLTASWSVGGGVATKSYNLEIWRSLSSGSGFVLWQQFPTKETSYTFKANARYYHKAQVSAISFNGTKSTASGLTVTAVQPLGKSTSPLTPTGASVSVIGNGLIQVVWDQCNDPDYDRSELAVSATTPGSSSAQAILTVKTIRAVLYWGFAGSNMYVRHINRSNLASPWTSAGAISIGALDSSMIGPSSITIAKMGSLSVGTSQLVDTSVTNIKMATNSVDTAQLFGLCVTTVKIADGNVTLAKMAANSVSTSQYVAGSIDTAALGFACITSAKVVAGAIGSSELAASCVTNAKMATNSVDSAQIIAGSVALLKLAVNAAGNAASASGGTATSVSANPGSSYSATLVTGTVRVTTAGTLGATIGGSSYPASTAPIGWAAFVGTGGGGNQTFSVSGTAVTNNINIAVVGVR